MSTASLLCVPDPTSTQSKEVKNLMKTIQPIPTRQGPPVDRFIPKNLHDCDRVLVSIGKLQNGFVSPYEGPYTVVRRLRKSFILDKNGKHTNVSIDRLKRVCYTSPASDAVQISKTPHRRHVKFSLSTDIRNFHKRQRITEMAQDQRSASKLQAPSE